MMKRIPLIFAIITLFAVFFSPTLAQHSQTGTLTHIAESFYGNIAISEDGRYVVFRGYDSIIPQDTNTYSDIFVYDAQLDTIRLVSKGWDGQQSNGNSLIPSISSDGRFIAFGSSATNLVQYDTNNKGDIFVYDQTTDKITLISVNSDGIQSNGNSYNAVISGDGRSVAFISEGKNLVVGDTDNNTDVFVHDRQTRQTTMVSVTSSGLSRSGNAGSRLDISTDGRYVVFDTISNLVDTSGSNGYLHDRHTAQTYRVTRRYWDGASPLAISGNMVRSISVTDDGRYVVYVSDANNIVPNDYNGGEADVFIYDRLLDETTSITQPKGSGGNAMISTSSSITPDGAYIVYTSTIENTIPSDTNNFGDVFLYHIATGTTELLSVTDTGIQGDGNSYDVAVSADGSTAAFISEANNFAPVTGNYHLFVKSVILPTTPPTAPTLLSPTTGTSTSDTNTTFSWDVVSGATAYQIQFATDSDFIQLQAQETVSDPTISISLVPNAYYWRVRAKNGSLFGAWSETRTFSRTFADVPVLIAPADMTAIIAPNQIFTWGLMDGVETYDLQIASDGAFTSLVLDTVSATNNYPYLLPNNGTFYWRVRARNGAYISDWSTPFTINITPLSAPSLIAPVDMTSAIDPNQTFTWDAVDNAERYLFQVASDSEFTTIVRAMMTANNSFTHRFSNDGTFYWRVMATNITNGGAWSTPLTITINRLPAPNIIAPADMFTTTETAVELSWDAVPNATEYKVFIARSTTFTDEQSVFSVGTNTSYVFSPAQGGIYYWRVIPYFGTFVGTRTETRQLTLDLLPIPTALAPITNTTTPSSTVTFTWDAVAGATDYVVQINTVDYFPPGTHYFTSTNSYTHTFTNPSTYYWRVYAINDLVGSGYSPIHQVNLIRLDTPNLVVPADMTTITTANATFSWDAVTNATDYQFQISTDSTFSSTLVNQTVSATNYDYAFTEGGIYYWRVQATGTNTFSSVWSDARQITVDVSAIVPPTLLTPVQDSVTTNPAVTFTWSPVAGATSYEFHLADNPAYSGAILAQTLTDTTLNSDMPLADVYYWRVRAKIGVLGGIWATGSFTYNLYDAPSNLQPENNLSIIAPSADITFSWDAVSHVTSYQFQISVYSNMLSPLVDTITPTNNYQYTLAHTSFRSIYWRVRGRDGERFGNWSEIRKITIAQITTPILLSPANEITVNTAQHTFTWEAVPGATSYSFQITYDSGFPGNTQIFTSSGTSRSYTFPPNYIRTYYWRVRAYSPSLGESAWSQPRVITYGGLAAPTPLSPIMVDLDSSPVSLNWTSVANATNYEVEVLDASTLMRVSLTLTGSTTYNLNAIVTKPGAYYWRVRSVQSATAGPWSESIPFNLLPLPTPILNTPLNNFEDTDPTPTFTWNPVAGATSYTLQISYHENFSSILRNRDAGLNTSYTESLSYGNYYWRVIAYKGSLGTPSEVRYYYGKPLYTPLLIAPINLSTLLNNNVAFSWGAVADAETYQFQIGTAINFGTILHDTTIATTTYNHILEDGNGYFWRVRSLHSNGAISPWSQGRYFTINPLPAPNLIAPADMTTSIIPSVAFSWDAVTDATSYDIQIATDNLFEVGVVNQNVATTSHNHLFTTPNTYYWRVRAVKGIGKGNWSVGRQVVIEAPAVPNLTTPIDGFTTIYTNVAFNWDATPNATSYHIQISTTNTFMTIVNDQIVATNSHTYSAPFGTYYWRVRAQVDTLNGAWSATRTFTTHPLAIPNLIAPSNMATITDPNVSFTWGAIAEATGYVIQISADNTFTTLLDEQAVVTANHSLFMPIAGTYYWRVRATEGVLLSEWSASNSFIVEILPAPTNLLPAHSSVAYDANTTFSWDAVAGATEYQIQIATDSQMTQIIQDQTVTGTSHNHTLPALGVYYWRVRATATTIIGVWSAPNSLAIFLPAPTLIAPANATSATVSDVTFTWDAVAGATEYRIQISQDPDFATVGSNYVVSDTSYTRQFIFPGTYYWRVRVADNATWSEVRQLIMTPHPAPNVIAPVDMASISGSDVTFTWDAVAGVTDYRIQISTNSLFTTILFNHEMTTTSHTQTFTTPDTYYWRVQGVYGSPSAVRQFTIQVPATPNLLTPVDMTVTPIADVSFSWDAVAGATEYQIQIASDSGFTTILHDQTISTPSVSYTMDTFGTYYWRVRAKQNMLYGAWSHTRQYQILPLSAPTLTSPDDMTTTNNPNLAFMWDVVTNATSYQIQIAIDSGFAGVIYDANPTANNHPQFVTGIGTYYWRVRAKFDTLNGVWSQTRQFTLETAPPVAPNLIAPADMSATVENIITFSWDVLPDVAQYQIQISTDSAFGTFTANQTQTETTYTRSFTEAGIYYWRVRGQNGSLDGAWTTYQFTIQKLPAPILVAPEDMVTTIDSSFYLSWTPVVGAISYVLQISDTPDFTGNNHALSGISSGWHMQLRLGVNYWRVLAQKGQIRGEWSEVRRVVLDPLPAPVMVSPSNNAVTTNIVTLTWEPVEFATRYFVEFSPAISATYQEEFDAISRTYYIPMTIQDQPISWRVKAGDWGANEGTWSEWRQFNLESMGTPQIINPLHNANSEQSPIDQTVEFSWGGVFRATSYQVQVSTSQNMSDISRIIFDEVVTGTTWTQNLPQGTYYWWIRSVNASGWGYWTTPVSEFTVAPLPAPRNLSPASPPLIRTYTILFTWDAVPEATEYQLQISYGSGEFTTIAFDTTVTNPIASLTFPDGTGFTYWRVRAINADGDTSVWSNENFHIYIVTNLIAPQNMAIISNPIVELSWAGDDAIDEYQVQVATDDTFTNLITDTVVATTSTTQTLDTADDYYWRVRGVLDEGEDTWSEVRQFTVDRVIIEQEANEQTLFNAMMPNLTSSFQFAIMDARPGGVLTTLQFTDGTVADVMVNITLDNGLILITLADIAIQGGGTQAQLDMLYQDVPTMMMATLDDLLPDDYVSIESLTITDVGMTITAITP